MGVVVARDAGDDGDLALEFGGGWRGGGRFRVRVRWAQARRVRLWVPRVRGSWRGGVGGGRFWRRAVSVGAGSGVGAAGVGSSVAASGSTPSWGGSGRSASAGGRSAEGLSSRSGWSAGTADSGAARGSATGGASAAGGLGGGRLGGGRRWRRGRLDGGGLRGGRRAKGWKRCVGNLSSSPGSRTGVAGARTRSWGPRRGPARRGGRGRAADTGGAGGCCGPAGRAGG